MNRPQENTEFRKRILGKRRRRGVYVLELVLILPIVLLVLMILYQVSVMLTSYQVMRLAVFTASSAAVQADPNQDLKTQIENSLKASLSNYYLGKDLTEADCITWAQDSTAWTNDSNAGKKILYRILIPDGKNADGSQKWKYFPESTAGSSTPLSGTFALEVRFQNLAERFPQYWVLSRFVGVDDAKSSSIVLSQVTAK